MTDQKKDRWMLGLFAVCLAILLSWAAFKNFGCHFHLITVETVDISPQFGGSDPDMIEFTEIDDDDTPRVSGL